MADDRLFHVQVISPDRIFYEGEADMLELRTTEGEIGILKGHIPMTSIIDPGLLRIMNGEENKEASLLAGFVEILPDSVTIMAEVCEWPDEIDINRANEAKIRAERRLKGHEGEISFTRAEMALKKSLVRLELAQRYGKH